MRHYDVGVVVHFESIHIASLITTYTFSIQMLIGNLSLLHVGRILADVFLIGESLALAHIRSSYFPAVKFLAVKSGIFFIETLESVGVFLRGRLLVVAIVRSIALGQRTFVSEPAHDGQSFSKSCICCAASVCSKTLCLGFEKVVLGLVPFFIIQVLKLGQKGSRVVHYRSY